MEEGAIGSSSRSKLDPSKNATSTSAPPKVQSPSKHRSDWSIKDILRHVDEHSTRMEAMDKLRQLPDSRKETATRSKPSAGQPPSILEPGNGKVADYASFLASIVECRTGAPQPLGGLDLPDDVEGDQDLPTALPNPIASGLGSSNDGKTSLSVMGRICDAWIRHSVGTMKAMRTDVLQVQSILEDLARACSMGDENVGQVDEGTSASSFIARVRQAGEMVIRMVDDAGPAVV